MLLQCRYYLPANILIFQKMLAKRFLMSVHFTNVTDRHLDEKEVLQKSAIATVKKGTTEAFYRILILDCLVLWENYSKAKPLLAVLAKTKWPGLVVLSPANVAQDLKLLSRRTGSGYQFEALHTRTDPHSLIFQTLRLCVASRSCPCSKHRQRLVEAVDFHF